jgi:putative membrane protein
VVSETERVEAPVGTVLARFSWSWLRFAPLTLSGLAAIGALLGFGWQFVNELGIDQAEYFQRAFAWGQGVADRVDAVLLLVVSVLALVALLNLVGSVLIYILQYWGYELRRMPDGNFRVRRGLLTTRAVSIEERRVRGVEIGEAVLLRAARGAKAAVVTSGRTGEGGELLTPPASSAQVHAVCAEVLGVRPPPTLAPLRRHPFAAFRRMILGDLLFLAAVTFGAVVGAHLGVWPWWTLWVPAVFVPIDLVTAAFAYRYLGHALTARYLVSRQGFLVRRTVALQRTGIAGWEVRQRFFQRRSGLATVVAFTAAGNGKYEISDLGAGDAADLAERATPGLIRPFLAE